MFMKYMFAIFYLLFNFSFSQHDTIYTRDTTIVNVRIINHTDQSLNYYSLIEGKKKIMMIPLESVKKTAFENQHIEVFCDLMSTKKFLSTEALITINYGSRDSLWLDDKIYTLLKSDLKKYNSLIDALNYMGNEGWQTISSYSTSNNSYIVEHYILKKRLTK